MKFSLVASSIAFLLTITVAMGQDKVVPKIEWEAETTGDNNGFGSVLLDGDQVVAGDDLGSLRAFDRKTGEIRWTHEHGSRIFGVPSADDSKVYFVSQKGLTAVKGKDGELEWNYFVKNGADFCMLAKNAKCVIVGGYDGNIHAVSADSGVDLWTLNIVDDAPADPPGFDGARARFGNLPARPAGIVCDETCAYVCIFDQCRVVAIDLKSGKKKWSFQTEGWVSSAPSLSTDSLVVGSQDNHIWCLHKNTGELKWKLKTGGRADDRSSIENERVYFGASDGRLYCVQMKDGKEIWRFETDANDKGKPTQIFSKPHLSANRVTFVARDSKLYSPDKETGKLSWKFPVAEKSEAYCDTISDGERVYLVLRKSDQGGQNAIVAITPAE